MQCTKAAAVNGPIIFYFFGKKAKIEYWKEKTDTRLNLA
jgi:hypothetical protein